MSVPVLTNAAVLASLAERQGLLPHARHADLPTLARALVALHATEPTSIYLSARARLPGFERAWMDRALFGERSLVRWLCMRRTLWVLRPEDVPVVHQACVPRLLGPEERRLRKLVVMGDLVDEAGAADRVRDIEARVLGVVEALGQAYGTDISARVPEMKATFPYALDKPYGGYFALGSRINAVVCMRGGMVRARPKGGWRSNQYSYALRERWLPGVDPEGMDQGEARVELVRRYLEAYGPVSLDDVQWWTGFTKTQARKALSTLGKEAAPVHFEGQEQWSLAADVGSIVSRQAVDPSQVWLLPTLDPLIMAYKDRRRFLADADRKVLFDRNGNAGPSIWAGGRVVGGWAQRKDGSIATKLFVGIGSEGERALEVEIERLRAFLGEEKVLPNFPTPLMKELRS